MSVKGIIKHFRAQISDREPWKAAHDEAIKVLMMEDDFRTLQGAISGLELIDQELQKEATSVSSKDKQAVMYKAWSIALPRVFKYALAKLQKIRSFADRVRYFTDYQCRYSVADFDALEAQLKWLIDPHGTIEAKLPPADVVKDDLREGRCERFTPGA